MRKVEAKIHAFFNFIPGRKWLVIFTPRPLYLGIRKQVLHNIGYFGER
jgi:hypothetical protein